MDKSYLWLFRHEIGQALTAKTTKKPVSAMADPVLFGVILDNDLTSDAFK
jgi:hypothetical protein